MTLIYDHMAPSARHMRGGKRLMSQRGGRGMEFAIVFNDVEHFAFDANASNRDM